MSSTKKNASDEEVGTEIEGCRIGDPEGVVICDGCSSRLHFGIGEGRRVEAEMTGYATKPADRTWPWKLVHVFCVDCDAALDEQGTARFDEVSIDFQAVLTGASHGQQPTVTNVAVRERSRTNEGTP